MTVLTKGQIQRCVEEGILKVDPWSPSRLRDAALDLRLGSAFRLFKRFNCAISVSENPEHYKTLTDKRWVAEGDYLFLMPGQTAFGITAEKITLPPDICARISGLEKLSHLSLLVHPACPFVHPGVSNHQVLELTNLGNQGLALRPGIVICRITFSRTEGCGEYAGSFVVQTPETF